MTRAGRQGVWLAIALLAIGAGRAQAQVPEPIGLFAADVRAVFPAYPQDVTVAGDLEIEPLSLPGRGLGLVFGGHLYPLRAGIVTFGFGAEWLASRGRKAVPLAADPEVDGPEVETRFSSLSPQVSLNFGARQGWSYVTAGLGRGHLESETVESPLSDADSVKVLNYGGGARWFAKEHLALSLDLRFYSVSSQVATGTRPGYPKTRLLVLSAGVSFK